MLLKWFILLLEFNWSSIWLDGFYGMLVRQAKTTSPGAAPCFVVFSLDHQTVLRN